MVLIDYLKSIADAIRYAEGSDGEISAQLFAERIKALKSLGDPDEPIIPEVPQTGTWQLKNTTDKKYLIIGTDDDNPGNTKFFRLLRTYDFPYTMNVEAENVSPAKALGSDVDSDIFTSEDASALFPDGVDVITLGKYIYDNDLGEVAQHGASSKTLWNSSKLTGTFLTELHSSYVSNGGTKTEDELRTAIMEQLADSDINQGATYVENSREILEEAYGFPICTVGLWGGNPTATIDGIECSLNSIKGGSNYDWRGHNYLAAGSLLNAYTPNVSTYDISRETHNLDDVISWVEKIDAGKAYELFWHMPFNDEPDISKWRSVFDEIKSMVDNGEVDVITRKEYAELGEWVDNPVTKITINRENIALGEADSNDAYTIMATYADNSTADVSDEAILNRSNVNTESLGTYTVSATYRGINATTTISVIDTSYTIPEGLKDTEYWFIAKNETQNKMIAGNTTGAFGNAVNSAGNLVFSGCTAGNLNGWTSDDNGATWTKVNDNQVHYQTIKTNATSGASYFYFGNAQSDDITWLETSGNFELSY